MLFLATKAGKKNTQKKPRMPTRKKIFLGGFIVFFKYNTFAWIKTKLAKFIWYE